MKHNLFPHERSTSLDKHDKKRGSSHRPRDERYHRIGSPARDWQYLHRSKSPVYRRSRSPKWNERYYDRSKSPERDGRYRYRTCRQIPLQDRRSYISRSPIRKESYHYRSKSSVRDEGYLQDGSSYISRSPVRINPDEFYEKSSVGECDVGNFNTLSKIGHEESDRSISGYSEKKATNKMSKDGSKENGNCSSSCINEKAINSVSKGESKDESVNSITSDINENVKSSKEGRTGTEDKSIDESSVIVTEDCISSCSNKMSNDYFEKRNIHEDISDTSLNDDMQKQSDSETTVTNAENMVSNETRDIEIIQELYKQNDQLVDVHNLVKTESKELTYSSLERSLPGESMTDEFFGRKIPTEAMKTVENYENTCLKKPVPKNPKIAKISFMKPVHKILNIAETSIMKSVLKTPEIAKHGLTELEHHKDKIQDKKLEIEVEEKFYNNCEVTKAIPKVLKVEPVMREEIGGMKIRPCSDCPRSFSNASTIVVHREVHSGTSIMNCNYCTFTGNRKSMLMHTRAKHTGEKLFECDFCKKRFASCASKKSHEKNCS